MEEGIEEKSRRRDERKGSERELNRKEEKE